MTDLRATGYCSQRTPAVNRALRSRGVKFQVADLVQGALSEVGFGPTLPVISRSYVDTEFHGSLNSPSVDFADSNESLPKTDALPD